MYPENTEGTQVIIGDQVYCYCNYILQLLAVRVDPDQECRKLMTRCKRPTYQFENTLEPHYNDHFGVHSDTTVITEQPYRD